jgi:hypothetical protein
MRLLPISPLLLVVFTGSAMAFDPTTQGQGINIEQLDQWSRDRGELLHAPEMKPPPQPAQREALRPSPVPLACMSVQAWKPVLAAPQAGAATIGYTQPQVAVIQQQGPWVQILYYNGSAGYVPVGSVHPFESTVKPGVKCTVVGLRPGGQPVFDLQ